MPTLHTTSDAIETAEQLLDVVDLDNRNLEFLRTRLSPSEIDADTAFMMSSAEVNARIVALWRQSGRQVLFVHPDLADVIGHVEGDIVTETLVALPYRCPFVCLPEPILVAEDPNTNTEGYLAGFYTFGRHGGDSVEALSDTHDPANTLFSVLALVQVRDADTGELKTVEFNRLSIPISRSSVDIAEVARDLTANGRYRHFNGAVTGNNEYIETIFRFVLASLSYLVSTSLDAETIPASQARKMNKLRSARGKTPALTKVGWKLGPALSMARRDAERVRQSGAKGVTRAPHAVRAHFKTVWTGPGRAVPKTAFIAPYLTGTGQLTDTTIHIVK